MDDDSGIRETMRMIFERNGMKVATFADSESFLAALPAVIDDCCLVVDAALPGISGLQLLQKLADEAIPMPACAACCHRNTAPTPPKPAAATRLATSPA